MYEQGSNYSGNNNFVYLFVVVALVMGFTVGFTFDEEQEIVEEQVQSQQVDQEMSMVDEEFDSEEVEEKIEAMKGKFLEKGIELEIMGFTVSFTIDDVPEMVKAWLIDEEEREFLEARDELKEQYRREKENEIVEEHVNALIEDSEVEKNMEVLKEGEADEVVATVNGEEIMKEEIDEIAEQQRQQIEQQMSMMGEEIDSEEIDKRIEVMKVQILDMQVEIAIVNQAVQEYEETVDEEELEERYDEVIEELGGEEMLDQMAERMGMSEEEIEEQIAIIVYLENYLEGRSEELEPSEEELREMFEAQKDSPDQPQINIEEVEDMDI